MTLSLLAITAGLATLLVYICGWLYVGTIALKRWIYDEDPIHRNKAPFALWLHRTFFKYGKVEYGIELFAACFMLGIVSVIIAMTLYFPVGRLVLVISGGSTVLIFISAHSLRWMVRIKKSISESKDASNRQREV